ncbi:lipopolysaccharide biosynthesis protein [Ruoffia sp. FAM 24228]|uniref:lipopolysaccharide biosynthesis protein n=1 Tax=Ruoffia sp. FAM 24228 TaxID=3259517 RepID=UPI0038858848
MINKIYQTLKNGIIGDAILNIIATAILTVANQIVVYPFLSRNMLANEYGDFLTIIGIINTVAVSFGNTLNISRLLAQPMYSVEKKIGDFNLIFLKVVTYVSLILLVIFSFFFDLSVFTIFLLIILAILITFRSYYVVDFRIILNYKKLLIMNILGVFGYIFGLLLFNTVNNWIIVFILGELFSCIYLMLQSGTVREPLIKTELYKQVNDKYYTLILSAFVSNSSQYLDRFLINPFLGSTEVSVYTVASFLGKSLNIVISPINSVILSYSVNEKFISSRQLYRKFIEYALIYLFMYILILLFGPMILKVLYPTIAEETQPYFAIANLSTIIMGYGGTLMQLLLRYSKPKWQLFINTIYLTLYFITSLFGLYFGGLLGFSIAILISNTTRVIIMIVILIHSVKINPQNRKG